MTHSEDVTPGDPGTAAPSMAGQGETDLEHHAACDGLWPLLLAATISPEEEHTSCPNGLHKTVESSPSVQITDTTGLTPGPVQGAWKGENVDILMKKSH